MVMDEEIGAAPNVDKSWIQDMRAAGGSTTHTADGERPHYVVSSGFSYEGANIDVTCDVGAKTAP